ncbi:hypothetical protein [Thermochromatium tepidum]|uniref:PASTA domain-containing protein n=1 Tax=Thermochromatium tepidum ATCC 43061 TaxID=316276 RepID=A0A6I6EGS1_THETI|nr:hypothetical protein [Thermochromatium tepidum]QGU32517.1 hypothetical protein E6P07_05675 [Thermochromatium tepidum ATCC 43061]
MKPRLKAIACCIAMSSLLLSACATQPRFDAKASVPASGPVPIDTTDLPRLMLPGATAAEVRSLALGAARSRGWTVKHVDLDNERLVIERPVEAIPGVAAKPGSTVEVTTLLKNTGGGIEVATLAELVTPPYAGHPAERIDYTEPFRDTLMQSLDSLRERWIRYRERLARAVPPSRGWDDAWKDPNTPPSHKPLRDEGDDIQTAQALPPTSPPTSDTTPAPGDAGARSQAQIDHSAIPRPTYTPRPTMPSPGYTRPAAAPVVDASSPPTPLPEPPGPVAAPPVATRDTLVSLPRVEPVPAAASPRLLWSAKAEQYARQRGCQVTTSGSQLIESRQDGEVYKVPCQGSDSFLIRCQNDICQGLL